MSKILIDEDVLKALIDSASFEARYYRLYQGYGDFSDRVYAQIAKAEKAIEESKGKRFSVLEWHPASEKPEEKRQLLVRLDDERMSVDRVWIYKMSPEEKAEGCPEWDFERYFRRHVIEWAYLPV